MQNDIKILTDELFERLNIKIDLIEIVNVDASNIFNIKIKTDESGILIWPNGRNLDAIQNILKLMCSKKTWEKIKLHIEINDYIKTKEDRLFDFIKSKVSLVKKNKVDFQLPFYSAYDRKKIHAFISDMNDETIFTKSIWEWKQRRLYICKQAKKLTIDIDWDDI